ncbi:SDR family oxidoreductase [Acinetobacter sp. MD2(2019)]|uniref:SDR family oxidoreductase n=1 Tax=Acinetobacter sp. MD2(2019) TaxID=2605273 RepID=UPI002D1F3719|nr:SDR family oxidoreductase [Acinetobacter sp. MD2(2019)]MEB3753917.1 SDR family oxidoreductase [Acinetobacter sp. MD2(2019)]
MTTLQDQVVWITGASSGIGQALALVCAAQGAQVILSARREDELKNVLQSLAQPKRHDYVLMDVTNEAQVLAAHQTVLQKKGRIDWLINNAGVSQRALISETSMQTERKIMEVDYFGQVFLTKTVLPTLLAQGHGKIIFISSVAGLVGTQYRASYAAAKAAIHMWANSLRAEVADQGLAVSVIFPGFVHTNVSLNALNGAGNPQAQQDSAIEQGLDANSFAKRAISAVLAGQDYIVIGGMKEKLGVALSRVAPQLLYKMIRKVKVK